MVEVNENKGDAYYNLSKLLYNYVLGLQGAKPYGDWTMERALKEINTALENDKQGLYYQAAGRYLFCHAEISGSICQLRSSKPLAVSFCRFFLCRCQDQGTD